MSQLALGVTSNYMEGRVAEQVLPEGWFSPQNHCLAAPMQLVGHLLVHLYEALVLVGIYVYILLSVSALRECLKKKYKKVDWWSTLGGGVGFLQNREAIHFSFSF